MKRTKYMIMTDKNTWRSTNAAEIVRYAVHLDNPWIYRKVTFSDGYHTVTEWQRIDDRLEALVSGGYIPKVFGKLLEKR